MAFIVVIQSLSQVWLFVTLWTVAHQAPLSSIVSQSLLKFLSIESVMLSNLLILCHPLLLLPSVLPSIRVFSSESVLHIRWPKYWSFNFSSVLPMNIQDFLYWLDFFNWLDLLALQGTLKSLVQHHSSKASILWPSLWFNSYICKLLPGKPWL